MWAPHQYQVIIPAAGMSRRLAHLTSSRPKSLLDVGGNTIIGRSLDILDDRGIRRVTFVVGYMRELFRETLGRSYRGLKLEYVVSQDYASTEHGWSLYLAAESWARERRPVLFMDADNLYDPRLLDKVMASSHENVILVDSQFEGREREEELVLGAHGRVTGLKRGFVRDEPQCVGGFVGINRLSPGFMAILFEYMAGFFAAHGRRHKYERVFDRLVKEVDVELGYVLSDGLGWVNVNHEEDYAAARELVPLIESELLGKANPGIR